MLAQGNDLVPIPGTKRVKYLEENVAALDVQFSADELERIDAALPRGAAQGNRQPPGAMELLNG